MEFGRKVIVILGPTASGKSEAAIKLAKKFNGEVISADSRQIYRGMNVGTSKVPLDPSPPQMGRGTKGEGLIKKNYYSSGISHHMIDIVNPKTDYNVAKFKKAVDKIIPDILRRGKVPIICGGTGFWIKAVVDNAKFPEVKPDWKLRKKLNKLSTFQLFKVLKSLDSQRAKRVDKNNRVRLIRAIEICKAIGFVPGYRIQYTVYKFLQIGIELPKEKLYKNIKKRLEARFKQGMKKEVRNLHFKYGVSWKRLESFGLEYKWIALYLQNKMTEREMKEKLFQEIINYSKRQMTWFKKDKGIKWLNNYRKIEKEANKFNDLK